MKIDVRSCKLLISVKFIFFCLLLIIVIATEVISHDCQHIPPQPHEVVHGVPLLERNHHIDKRSTEQQRLRIHVVYDDSISALSEDKKNLVKDDLIPSAVTFWEQTLQVRNPKGPITLLRQCASKRIKYKENDRFPYCVDGCKSITKCGETEVPGAHLQACRYAPVNGNYTIQGYSGTGVSDTDFILYVSAHDKPRCSNSNTVAFSAYCQLESQSDRPVAGYMNLCPHEISLHSHHTYQMESTIKHEILHALGFSAGLYAFFRDDKGRPLTPRSPASGRPSFNRKTGLYQWSDSVVINVTRTDWSVKGGVTNKTAHFMVTPKVKEEARRHYGCDQLEGAELENQGMAGTSFTHWEKRVFENEVMTGTYTQDPIVSRITLALMEDTGWYWADYSKADDFSWGRDLGCPFVLQSCKHWIDEQKSRSAHIHPFCDVVKRPGEFRSECTEDRDAVAQCNLVQYNNSLPAQYQYFEELEGLDDDVDVGRYGGSVELADYCPYIQEVIWRRNGEFVRGSRCALPANNAAADRNHLLEKHSSDSKCFNHNGQWTLKHCYQHHVLERFGSGCYEYSCMNNTGLSLYVMGDEHKCYGAGQLIEVAVVSNDWLHQGSLLCPPCHEVCKDAGFVCPDEISPPQHSVEVPAVPCRSAPTCHHSLIVMICVAMVTKLFP